MTGLPVSGRLGPVPDSTHPEPARPVADRNLLVRIDEEWDWWLS